MDILVLPVRIQQPNKQLRITVPSNKGIVEGDYVMIRKLEMDEYNELMSEIEKKEQEKEDKKEQ